VVDEGMIGEFYREVSKFSLASHLLWSVWNVVQAGMSGLSYNFVGAARARFDEYVQYKDVNIAL
jgi:hypothetical protein